MRHNARVKNVAMAGLLLMNVLPDPANWLGSGNSFSKLYHSSTFALQNFVCLQTWVTLAWPLFCRIDMFSASCRNMNPCRCLTDPD